MSEGVRGTAIIPNLITIGNAVCGFVALSLIAGMRIDEAGVENPENIAKLAKAAWFILLGMVFDVFDGRVARMTGGTSSLGAQLDSLSDLVTFGIAPAGLVVATHRMVTQCPAGERGAFERAFGSVQPVVLPLSPRGRI